MSSAMVSFFDSFPEYDGQKIEIRGKDGYFSATDMSRVLNKRLADWRKTEFAKKLLARLSDRARMPVEERFQGTLGESSQCAKALIQYDLKGDQKVWIHPYVAMSYAMSNPEFQADVNIWIVDLMTIGTVNPNVLQWTKDEYQKGIEFNRDDIREMWGDR
jgi:hypothetical protein